MGILKTLLKLSVVLLLLGAGTLFLLVRLEHRSEMNLPKPTGQFAVGRTSFTWTNDKLADPLAPSPGTKRTVFVWMWYPASTTEAAPLADYMPPAWRSAQDASMGTLMRDYLSRDVARVRTNSVVDPAVASEQARYPVVVMRPGGGALTTDFSTLAEDLASHGYFVVGFDAPYRSRVVVFPDGRVARRQSANNPETMSYEAGAQLANKLLPMWTSDVSFVVDQLERLNVSGKFTGKLDLAKLGVFGHSFGGATALQFCHDDRRCAAGMDIDGMPFGSVIREGAEQPFFFLMSDHTSDFSTAEGRQVLMDIHSVYDHLQNARHAVVIRGANHFTFTDQMVTKSSYFVRAFLLVMRGPAAQRGLAITRAYIHTFFDVYLKGAPTPKLTQLRQFFPEVQPFDNLPPDALAAK